ncbi:MAG TPA: FtsX-like permease family protein [Methylomirabilota bacterium]|nr:FtsX-like permease family protein [Methylomirabilota bacterium]
MSAGTIILSSLRQHALSTWIAAVSLALAAGLLTSIWCIKDQSRAAFENSGAGFDAILAARGSKLQIALNSLFHLDESTGNINWSDYEQIRSNAAVQLAVPFAVGDSYEGYRIVGTLTNFITDVEYRRGQRFEMQSGRVFDQTLREAVVGSFVADRLGLKVGDHFHPAHGVGREAHDHDDEYLVVGILKPSNTPADRAIYIPVEGLQLMSGHDPKTAEQISAVLIKFKANSALVGRQLDNLYNKEGSRLTLVWPIGFVLAQLFERIGWFDRALTLVAGIVALVAIGTILASIYNTMSARRRDIAILRAIGASRSRIVTWIVLEAATIGLIGVVLGLVVHVALMAGAASLLRAQTGVVLNPFEWHPILVVAPISLLALSALAGFAPALKAYCTDVAANLTPLS